MNLVTADVLLAAVKIRWDTQGLGQIVTGGVTAGRPMERPATPHAIIENLTEASIAQTNTSRLHRISFDLNLYDVPPLETVAVHAGQLVEALLEAPLALDRGVLLKLMAYPLSYIEEDYFWHVPVAFEATVTMSRVKPI